MSVAHRIACLGLASLTVASCAPAVRGQRGGVAPGQDTALLTAVVRAAQADHGPLRLVVDPRPLRADGMIQAALPEYLAPISPPVLREREAALRRLGVELADAVAVQQDTSCTALFNWSYAADAQKTRRATGCPSTELGVVAMGLPRAGKARLPAGEVHDLNSSAAEGYWAVLVIVTTLGPDGRSVTGWDYVMERDDSGWSFVKGVGLFNAH